MIMPKPERINQHCQQDKAACAFLGGWVMMSCGLGRIVSGVKLCPCLLQLAQRLALSRADGSKESNMTDETVKRISEARTG